MAIAFKSQSIGTSASSTSTTITLPAGLAAGDVAVVVFVQAFNQWYANGAAFTITTPAGWNVAHNSNGVAVVWLASPTSSAVLTATSPNTNWWRSSCVVYTGCDTTAPIDVIQACVRVPASGANAVTHLDITAPSVNPNFNGAHLLAMHIDASISGKTIGTPSGYTSRSSTGTGPSIRVSDKALTDGSATGIAATTTSAVTGAGQFVGIHVVLKASGASAATLAAARVQLGAFVPQIATGLTSITLKLDLLGAKEGDYVVVLGSIGSTTATITAPSGYTALSSDRAGFCLVRRRQTGDATQPAVTFSASVNVTHYVFLLRKSGVSTADLGVESFAANDTVSASPIAVATPSATPVDALGYVLAYLGTNGGSTGTWSATVDPSTLEETQPAGPMARVGSVAPSGSSLLGPYSATATQASGSAGRGMLMAVSLGGTYGGGGASTAGNFFLVF